MVNANISGLSTIFHLIFRQNIDAELGPEESAAMKPITSKSEVGGSGGTPNLLSIGLSKDTLRQMGFTFKGETRQGQELLNAPEDEVKLHASRHADNLTQSKRKGKLSLAFLVRMTKGDITVVAGPPRTSAIYSMFLKHFRQS